jgi:hypothetical protein
MSVTPLLSVALVCTAITDPTGTVVALMLTEICGGFVSVTPMAMLAESAEFPEES